MILKQKKEVEMFSSRAAGNLLTTTKAMLLTKKQEQELFKKIARGDKNATSKLMNANLFLVKSIFNKYKDNNHYLSYKTLIEIGKGGLRKATALLFDNIEIYMIKYRRDNVPLI